MNSNKEQKRMKGEVSCAECRRLKTRCDRKVPCSTCVRRGCEILCPNGTVPPGGGSRFVGIAEEYLRRKVTKMEERMHSLEDALIIVLDSMPCSSIPLLDQRWTNREVQWTPGHKVEQYPIVDDKFNKYGLASDLGALYLDDSALSDLAPLGAFDNSESLLVKAKTFMTESPSMANHTEEISSSYLPSEVCLLHQAFPFSPRGIPAEAVRNSIESYLPPSPRATTLCETFLESTSWMFSIVSRQYILGELLPAVYNHANGQTQTQPRSYGPHDVALLFVVLAIGALVDPLLPPYNIEGQHYHILSRAALCLQSVFAQYSVVTVKTLHLMSVYNGMCGIDSKLDGSRTLLDMAAQVALQIGLHKDPSVWGITGREAYERRAYFWNLLHGTLWQSLIAGQPPVIAPFIVDCHMPTKDEEDTYQSGEVPLGFGTWSFSFIIDCIFPVVEATQAVHPASYDSVLELDSKIRQFVVPQGSSDGQISGQMQVYVRSQLRELVLLYLHRSFFAQALTDFPVDPSRSPFRQSFLIAYQSATKILDTTRTQFARQPVLCARVWRLWSTTFSAAIVIATVAIIPLTIKLEPEPFGQLELVCTLFREAAQTSVRARMALPILRRMRREATRIRLETPSYGVDSLFGEDQYQGLRDEHASSDSPTRPIYYPTPTIPSAEASSSQEPYLGTAKPASGWQPHVPYREM